MSAQDAVRELYVLGTSLIQAGRPQAGALALQAAAEVPGSNISHSHKAALLLLAARPPLQANMAAPLLVDAARVLSGLPASSMAGYATQLRAARAGLAEFHGLAVYNPDAGVQGGAWHSIAVGARVARLRRSRDYSSAVREARGAALASAQFCDSVGLTIMAAQAEMEAIANDQEVNILAPSDLDATERALNESKAPLLPADTALFRMALCMLRICFYLARGQGPRAARGVEQLKARYNEMCDAVKTSSEKPKWKWFPSRVLRVLTLHLTACACRPSLSSHARVLRSSTEAWTQVGANFEKFGRGISSSAREALRSCLGESLARTLVSNGQFFEASAVLEAVSQGEYSSSGVALAQGEVVWAMGRHGDALKWFSRALGLAESAEAKSHAWARRAIGMRKRRMGLPTFEPERPPKRPRVLAGAMRALVELGEDRGSSATEPLERAQQCLAEDGFASDEVLRSIIWLMLAEEHLAVGRAEAAMEMVECAEKILGPPGNDTPCDPLNRLYLARTLVRCMSSSVFADPRLPQVQLSILSLSDALAYARRLPQ